jgi:hypothetical protein
MLKIGFGSRIKPRGFDYSPRYYDPSKEALEDVLSKYSESKETGEDLDRMQSRIRSGLRAKKYIPESQYRSQSRASNFRLLYILLILGFIVYVLLGSDKITELFRLFESK